MSMVALGAPASAELLITPKRVVMTDEQPEASFRLVNTAAETRTYELGWRQMRMTPEGSLTEVEADAPGGVDRLVRLFPSRVTLGAGERQVVRVVARVPDGLPEGEYMSHLTFRPFGGETAPSDPSEAGANMRLNVRLGFSVPVILRRGALTAAASVQPIGIDVPGQRVQVRMVREGGASVFGNMEIYWGQPGQSGVRVGRLDGVAIYANVGERTALIPLDPPDGVRVGPGLLMVRYLDPDTNDVLAETTVRLD